MIFLKIKNKQKKSNSGFTLIELVVVMGIMGVMSSIILYNYAGFKSTASLDNLSQDIALSVREAQISAMGVKGLNIGMAQQFPGYGVHFKLSSLTSEPTMGDTKSFIFFGDVNNNKHYNQINSTICGNSSISSQDECLNIVDITGVDSINEICFTVNNTINCPSITENPSLDIIFTRPNLDAEFYFCSNGSCFSNISSATIKIKSSTTEKTKEITVESTGQISVK
jgi:prepilin-type N-terminal cleavage/methylation domain-containing protein